jgi:hypothetical protein
LTIQVLFYQIGFSQGDPKVDRVVVLRVEEMELFDRVERGVSIEEWSKCWGELRLGVAVSKGELVVG